MGLKEKTASSIKWNAIATVVTMVIGILQVAILTRLLEKSDFGLIAIATMVIAFTDIFAELGFTAALIHKQNITRETYSSVYWLNLVTSFVICGLTMLSAPLISKFYNQPELTIIVRILSLKILFCAFGKMFQTIKTKNLEFRFISTIRIITSVVGIITSTFLAWQGFGVMSLVWGQLAQIGLNQSIYAFVGLRQNHLLFHFSIDEVKDVLIIGGYQVGTQILDFIAARLDVFLIRKFFNMDQLGVYNIAKELILKPFLIINSISSSVFSVAFAKIQDNINSVIANYTKLIKIITILTVPIYTLMFVFADLIVSILYDPSFANVSDFIRILSIMGICSAITSQGAAVMMAFGRTDLGLKWTLARIMMSAVTLIITASISIYAVAFGYSFLSIVSLFVYYLIVIKPILKSVSLKQYFCMFIGITIMTLIISALFALINIVFDVSWVIQFLMGLVLLLLYYIFFHLKHRDELYDMISIILPFRKK